MRAKDTTNDFLITHAIQFHDAFERRAIKRHDPVARPQPQDCSDVVRIWSPHSHPVYHDGLGPNEEAAH